MAKLLRRPVTFDTAKEVDQLLNTLQTQERIMALWRALDAYQQEKLLDILIFWREKMATLLHPVRELVVRIGEQEVMVSALLFYGGPRARTGDAAQVRHDANSDDLARYGLEPGRWYPVLQGRPPKKPSRS